MNILFIVFTLVVSISAIRVPTVWPDEIVHTKHSKPIVYGSYHRKSVHDRQDIRVYPQKSKIRKYHHHVHQRPPKLSKVPSTVQKYYPKRKKFLNKHKPRQSMWTPIAPFSISTSLGFMPPKPNISFDLRQFPKTHYTPASSEYVTSRSSPPYENNKDDRTYKPGETKGEKISKFSPDVERPPLKESDHEYPSDISSAPVYPGEGEWAKPGRKHKPFISKQKYSQLPEESEEKPDGYEIFEMGKKLFDNKQSKFVDTRKKKYPETEGEDLNSQQEEEVEESDNENGFVPTTLYAQVRRTENEEHLPSDADDSEGGRLKEVVKDSKILTVYTEEGYEDSAYDHAGHEKEAEDSQGYKEYNKKEEIEHEPLHGSPENHRLINSDQNGDGSSKIYKAIKDPSQKSKRKKYSPKNINIYNKLIKTESTKTMKLKEEPDGTQTEITSEIKTMTNPNNNKTETIVQILPKIVEFSEPTEPKLELSSKSILSFPKEVPSTELAQVFSPQKMRRKRYTNDFPKLNVKTDFIDGIIGNYIPNLKSNEEKEKYPYYKSEHINRNSPLKYSENMDNIPIKTEGRMAFYEQANRVQCPEVDEDIESIPKRIQEVEKSVNSKEKLEDGEEAGKSPRLGKLGQRIDCFKRKYFGENPLDSPFFEEKEVESVPPIFKVHQERSAGFQANHIKTKEPMNSDMRKKYHSKFRNSRAKQEPSSITDKQNQASSMEELESHEIVNDVRIHDPEATSERSKMEPSLNYAHFTPQVEIINVDTFNSIDHVTTDSPSVSLITTPNYSIDITPNHIYDQIKLLEFLPSQSTKSIVAAVENLRRGKNVDDAAEAAPLLLRPSPKFQNYASRRPQRMKKRRPQFDVESFIRDPSRRVTIIPNSYNIENEAVYPEQTPLDQMNVFADVINNIKNGSNDPFRVEASTYNEPSYASSFQNPVIRMRVPPKKIHIKVPNSVKYSNERQIYYSTTTMPTTLRSTTKKSKRGSVRYAITTEKEINYDDYPDDENEMVYGSKNKLLTTSTSAVPVDEDIDDEVDSEVSGSHTTETIHKPPVKKHVDIIGLVPPSKYHYRTIYQPVEELVSEPIVAESEVVNNYHVLGMKPPSTKQKVYDYSDFQKLLASKTAYNHKYRDIGHRRGKRSPNRKSYFEVVRGQSSNDEEAVPQEEDDDYVPHRPKNWHWDENLKKIVYDNRKEENNSDLNDDEEEAVEIEVDDSTPRNIQLTTTRRSFTSTTPLNGPSYVDFVQILRSKKNYVSIPDPTTTKEDIKIETTSSATTVTAEPTEPSEFLSFVSKLRQSDSYKIIEEKNKTKITTTTTEIPEEEEVEDTKTALSNVQNSPGRGAVDIGQNFKIFDVNEFMPKVKTYLPRTEIDYSKYKTIQRPRTKTTTEANREVEEKNINVQDKNSSFSIKESEEPSSLSSTEGQVEIFELSRPTTPSSTTTSTTTIKIQRTRGRRPTTTHKTIASSESNTREDIAAVPANKPKRFYPRRRQPHIRTRTTTLKTEEMSNDGDNKPEESRRVILRRHNTVERSPKIISLEEIIKMDKPKNSRQQHSSFKSDIKSYNKSDGVTVDDILKNINRLKEISVEEVVPDYSLDIKSDISDRENTESSDEYFDDENSGIALDNSGTTNKKLVISKDKQKGMIYYTSVR